MHELLEHALHGEQAGESRSSFEIVLALLFEIAELDQERPAMRRQKIAQMARVQQIVLRQEPGSGRGSLRAVISIRRLHVAQARCVSGENWRIDSISSPTNSSR